MRKTISTLCLTLTASFALAGVRWQSYEVKIGTNATANVTDSHAINGQIDEVYVQNPSESGVTNQVAFIIAPTVGTNLTQTVIYTNNATSASVKARPRIIGTSTAGADLESLAIAEPFSCGGETVTFSITQSTAVTGVTVRAWLKIKQ